MFHASLRSRLAAASRSDPAIYSSARRWKYDRASSVSSAATATGSFTTLASSLTCSRDLRVISSCSSKVSGSSAFLAADKGDFLKLDYTALGVVDNYNVAGYIYEVNPDGSAKSAPIMALSDTGKQISSRASVVKEPVAVAADDTDDALSYFQRLAEE